MRALALRLEGPMQSWGAAVAGDDRPTLDAPTKSGVVGLLGAALGIGRSEVGELSRLDRSFELVVREDRAGSRGEDFHTALDVPKADGNVREQPVVSRRGYIFDASFVALLIESHADDRFPLESLRNALLHPRYFLYLGRRSCPLATPVLAHPTVIEADTWESVLATIPLRRDDARGEGAARRVWVDASLAPKGVGRRTRIRDRVAGTAPRLFHEREVVALERGAAHAPPSTSAEWLKEADAWSSSS